MLPKNGNINAVKNNAININFFIRPLPPKVSIKSLKKTYTSFAT
jgi:hypothetical protein